LDLPYPRAILIDLDDTILSLNASVDLCWRTVCNRYATETTGLEAGKLLAAIDKTRGWYWSDPGRHRSGRLKLHSARREVVNLAFKSLDINDSAAADSLADDYGAEMEKCILPFPGAADTLEHFKKNNVLLALLTNGASEIQRKKIDRFNLAPAFDIILVEEEMGFGKPDERVFRRALQHFGLGARDVWMAGDDLERDIAGAQAVGIFSFWVNSRNVELHLSSAIRPDRTIKSINEMV
jgi:putative hydrolase of the HAD superfamily